VLTGSTVEDDLLNSLQAGAQAYVLKGVTARELVNILHRVQEGERYVTPSLAANLHFEIKPPETEEKNKPEQRSS
jgi:DNA-binding NarL/FixJ family response regulator